MISGMREEGGGGLSSTKQNVHSVKIYKHIHVSIQPKPAKKGLEMVLRTEFRIGNASDFGDIAMLQRVAACCSVFKCGAVCDSELYCMAVCGSVWHCVAV